MQTQALLADWTRHLKGEKKEEFEKILRNSTYTLGVLREIIDDYLESVNKDSTSDYESPSWAYKQADKIGERRALTKVRNLLSFF